MSERWNTMAAAKWGAVAGLVWAIWHAAASPGWDEARIVFKAGGLIGGIVGGAALFALVSGARNLFVR